jgi:hypothetical protein
MSVEGWVSTYGRDWNFVGVAVDHIRIVLEEESDARLDVDENGDQVVVAADGSIYSVCCGEIVEVYSEDGYATGRCGRPVANGDWACWGHQSLYA